MVMLRSHPPPEIVDMKRRPALQIASLMTGYVVAGLFWGAFAASTPELQAKSGLDTAGFGLLLFAMTAGAFPAMTLLGRIMHRVQIWAMPACLAFFAAAALVLGLADGIAGLAIGFFLVGAASGALDVAMNMRVSVVEGETGARLFNRAHAMFPLALLVASPLTGAMRDAGVGSQAIFSSLGLLLAAAALLEFRAGGSPRRSDETEPASSIGLSAAVICLATIAALGAFMEMSAQSWAVIFVETVLLTSATAAGFAAAAFTLGLSLGRLAAHSLEKRLSDALVIRIGALMGVPAFLVIGLSGSLPMALAGLLVAGMAVGPVEPTVFRVVAGRYGPLERGRALSAVTAVAYLGYLISPPILGAIAQGAGWAVMWGAAAMVAGIVAVLTVSLVRLGRGAAVPNPPAAPR